MEATTQRKRSYHFGMSDLQTADWRHYGLLCRRQNGCVVTNLPKELQSQRRLEYGWGGDESLNQLQLAYHILSAFAPNVFALAGASKGAELLAGLLVEEILVTMPESGGRIEADTFHEWLYDKGWGDAVILGCDGRYAVA